MKTNGLFGVLLALNTDLGNGKHLFGSMIGNGSVAVICSVVGLAILVAIIVIWRKKNKDDKEEK